MKVSLLALGLLASLSSFAQVRPQQSAMAVCESIQQNTSNPALVTQCMQIISQNSFDPKVVSLLVKVAVNSRTDAINALNISANANYEDGAIQVCEAVRVNTSNLALVTDCLKVSANNSYAPEVSELATRVAVNNRTEAIAILKSTVNAYFQPEAVQVCEIVRANTSNLALVTQCLTTITNKMFINGTETICGRMAVNDRTNAIKCLASSAIPYVVVQEVMILVPASELRNLKRNLMRTRNMIERGMTEGALRGIDDANRSVEIMEARQ